MAPTRSASPPRSASPTLPPPPNAETPGPRAAALQTAFAKALDATLSKCSGANFGACFPTAAGAAPATLEAFRGAFVGRLAELCGAQFDDIVRARGVVPALNELDGLVRDAHARRERAAGREPPEWCAVPPEGLVEAHLRGFVEEEERRLGGALDDLRKENEELVQQLREQEAEMEKLVSGLEDVVKDLEGAAGMVQSAEVLALGGDIRMMEAELSG